LLIAVVSLFWLMDTSCANIAPPLGGARDSLPPVLMAAKPGDSALKFTGKKISLVFNEFIQLENAQENILVSPTPKQNPVVESKLKILNITLKDSLEPNTTYQIDFGETIKDINEGNILQGFKYIFSTGNYLDTSSISGRVLQAETGKPDSTLLVMLYTKGVDSAVYKEKPRYITRLDSLGRYRFENLKPGAYYLYAWKDEGGQRRYLSGKQLFAFADKQVSTSDSEIPVLYAYTEKDTTPPVRQTPSTRPGKPAAKPAANPAADKRLRLDFNLENGELDLLKTLEIGFQLAPVKKLDTSKIGFYNEKWQPITDYKIVQDSSKKKLVFKYKWTENTIYQLVLKKEFAEDTAGRKMTRAIDTLSFKTKKISAYGTVRFRFLNLDLSKNPILQWVQSEKVMESSKLTGKELNIKMFTPGEYELRILYDTNNNGIWDPGMFFKERRQPEKVLAITRKVNIKANWDNEIDFKL